MTTNIQFHPNSTSSWYNFISLCDSNKAHNPLCKIDSKSCSVDMSQINDLCQWHYYRMATHHNFPCGCGSEKYFCSGDATGRHIFREYYNCWDIPVQDLSGKIYCCGQCQNRDAETHTCGRMLVGECCLNKHPSSKKIKQNDSDDESENDSDE